MHYTKQSQRRSLFAGARERDNRFGEVFVSRRRTGASRGMYQEDRRKSIDDAALIEDANLSTSSDATPVSSTGVIIRDVFEQELRICLDPTANVDEQCFTSLRADIDTKATEVYGYISPLSLDDLRSMGFDGHWTPSTLPVFFGNGREEVVEGGTVTVTFRIRGEDKIFKDIVLHVAPTDWDAKYDIRLGKLFIDQHLDYFLGLWNRQREITQPKFHEHFCCNSAARGPASLYTKGISFDSPPLSVAPYRPNGTIPPVVNDKPSIRNNFRSAFAYLGKNTSGVEQVCAARTPKAKADADMALFSKRNVLPWFRRWRS